MFPISTVLVVIILENVYTIYSLYLPLKLKHQTLSFTIPSTLKPVTELKHDSGL